MEVNDNKTYFTKNNCDDMSDFMQFPRRLNTLGLTALSQLLYMYLSDKARLSVRNGWVDELGRAYVYFTLNDMMKALTCSDDSAIKYKNELIKKGLLVQIRQGQGKPNKLFPCKLDSFLETGKNRSQETTKIEVKKPQECITSNNDMSNNNMSKIFSYEKIIGSCEPKVFFDDYSLKETRKTNDTLNINPIKEQPTKFASLINCEEFKFIEELINKDNSPFKKHKVNYNNPTKILINSVSFIKQIEEGTFLINQTVSNGFDSKNGSKDSKGLVKKLERPLFFNEAKDLIIKAYDALILRLYDDDYLPYDKTKLIKSITIENWFYNSKNQYSLFYDCISIGASRKSIINANKILESVPTYFSAPILKKVPLSICNDNEKIPLAKFIKSYYLLYTSLNEQYKDLYYNTNWINYFSTPSAFSDRIVDFVVHNNLTNNIFFLSSGTSMQKFINWAYTNYSVILSPTKDDLDRMILDKEYHDREMSHRESERIAHEKELAKLDEITQKRIAQSKIDKEARDNRIREREELAKIVEARREAEKPVQTPEEAQLYKDLMDLSFLDEEKENKN